MTTQPEKKFKAGAVTATIWQNTTEKDGKKTTYPTITLNRVYMDPEGQWQNTPTLRTGDLPKANLVLNKAYEYLALTPVAEEI